MKYQTIFLLLVLSFTLTFAVAGEGPNNGEGIIPRDLNAFERARVGTEVASSLIYPSQGFAIASHEDTNYQEINRRQVGNLTTVRYQYFYRGVPVMGSQVVVNMNENTQEVLSAAGFEFKIDPSLSTNPSVSIEQAIASAKSYFDVAGLQHEEDHLAVLCTDQTSHLVWAFVLYDDMQLRWQFMVDAHDGSIRGAYNLIQEFTIEGKTNIITDGEVSKSGKVSIGCSHDGGTHRLSSEVKGTEVRTYNMKKSSSTQDGQEDDSANPNDWEDPIVGTAHYYTEQLAVFYKEILDRDSIDNNHFTLKSRVRYGNNYNNAFWNNRLMTYGDGNWNGSSGMFSPLCVADVVSHELTHGVTSRTSNLVYRNEPGAMNESLSDIIGNTFEYWLQMQNGNKNSDWTKVGEECVPSGSSLKRDALRYMKDPTLAKDPKEYKGEHWYTGWGDNGGVHTNSGVGNRAFYLVAAGGEQNGITIEGVGVLLAGKIFHYSNVSHLTSRSTYKDWPAACLKALEQNITDEDIQKYGKEGITREQVRQSVIDTWKAVKVWQEDVLSLLATHEVSEQKSRYLNANENLTVEVYLTAGHTYEVSASFEGQDVDVYLYNHDGLKVVSANKHNTDKETVSFSPKKSGLFTVGVHAFKGEGMAQVTVANK